MLPCQHRHYDGRAANTCAEARVHENGFHVLLAEVLAASAFVDLDGLDRHYLQRKELSICFLGKRLVVLPIIISSVYNQSWVRREESDRKCREPLARFTLGS